MAKRNSKQNQNKGQANKNNNKREKWMKNPRNNKNFQDKFADQQFGRGEQTEKDILKKYNDANWYTKNPQTLKDVASFSYLSALGTPMYPAKEIQYISDGTYKHNVAATSYTGSVPGLMALGILPTIGTSVNASSPANIAAQNVYAYNRRMLSGRKNYDPTDLMLYYVALDSMYACWNWMKRLVGLAAKYSQLNRYMPRAYFAANNVDFDDFINNQADFRGYLNKAAASISAFAAPAVFSYNVRHSWLFSNVFKDSNTKKAQQYMFVPRAFYKYDETSSVQGGQLVTIPILDVTTPLKVNDLINIMESMLQAMVYSEDIGIMSGDTIKVYGEGNLFTLSRVTEDYTVEPVYSEEVLSQIENALPIQVSAEGIAATKIYQDPNTNELLFNLPASTQGCPISQGAYINMHKEDITPEDTIVATRLTARVVEVSADLKTVTKMVYGSEIMTTLTMYYFASTKDASTSNDPKNMKLQWVNIGNPQFDSEHDDQWINVRNLAVFSMIIGFDWAPRVWLNYKDASIEGNAWITLVGSNTDWDMYTFVTNEDLDNMHSVAVLSEFNVPDYGTTF